MLYWIIYLYSYLRVASGKIYVSPTVHRALTGATKGRMWECSSPTNTKLGAGWGRSSASTATSGIFSSIPWSYFLELENSLCEFRHSPGDWQYPWKSFKHLITVHSGEPQVVWKADHRLCWNLSPLEQGKETEVRVTPHRHQQYHCLHKMPQLSLRRSVAQRVSQHFIEHVIGTLSEGGESRVQRACCYNSSQQKLRIKAILLNFWHSALCNSTYWLNF